MDDDALLEAVDRFYIDHDYKLNDLTHSKTGMGAEGVYGEITTPETLFKALDLRSTDHFVDMGSGRGQLVLAAALRTAGAVPTSSIGIELAENRHLAAQSALDKATPATKSICRVVHGDASAADMTDTTKAFICNPTFPSELDRKLAQSLAPARAPKLELLATIKELDPACTTAAGLSLHRVRDWDYKSCPLPSCRFKLGLAERRMCDLVLADHCHQDHMGKSGHRLVRLQKRH